MMILRTYVRMCLTKISPGLHLWPNRSVHARWIFNTSHFPVTRGLYTTFFSSLLIYILFQLVLASITFKRDHTVAAGREGALCHVEHWSLFIRVIQCFVEQQLFIYVFSASRQKGRKTERVMKILLFHFKLHRNCENIQSKVSKFGFFVGEEIKTLITQ